ncbi:hypothetical protein MUA03_09970 [Enterobacteriaceae bacterium H16N7]|nr:hypothetical protein [Dryocola clanedunensis]
MKINSMLTPATALLAILSCLIPFAADIHLPLLHGHTVTWIENSQAILLLLGAVLTFAYMKPMRLPEGSRKFWLWSALWWVVLLGRSTSWGRDYLPELPKIVFRSISEILIASLVLSFLLSAQLRKEIAFRMKNLSIPLWTCLLVVVTFLLADTVEHHRLLSPLFLHDRHYQDLTEELFETPFIIGLLLISFDFMKQEVQYKNSFSDSLLTLDYRQSMRKV